MSRGWIGVDFDGTLAHYENFDGPLTFGAPIPEMVDKVRRALKEGYEVRIFTARVSDPDPEMAQRIKIAIQNWCFENIGAYLAVTNMKDYSMLEQWDDRAIQVVANMGEFVGKSELI